MGRRALLLKAGGGLVVISIAAVALFFGLKRPEPPVARAVTQQANPAVSAFVSDPIALEPALPAAPEVPAPSAAASNREARGVGAPSKRPSKAAPMESGADLSEQLRLIDAARTAVAAGNASAASAALSSYRTRFPRGPFGQEAAVLQIETLDLQGNHAQAAILARSFLARHPNSPHVSVVQRIADH